MKLVQVIAISKGVSKRRKKYIENKTNFECAYLRNGVKLKMPYPKEIRIESIIYFCTGSVELQKSENIIFQCTLVYCIF